MVRLDPPITELTQASKKTEIIWFKNGEICILPQKYFATEVMSQIGHVS